MTGRGSGSSRKTEGLGKKTKLHWVVCKAVVAKGCVWRRWSVLMAEGCVPEPREWQKALGLQVCPALPSAAAVPCWTHA